VVPREIGCSGRTAARLLRGWRATGVWERVQRELLRGFDRAGRIDWSHGIVTASHALSSGPPDRSLPG
jgi:hypothetical protein